MDMSTEKKTFIVKAEEVSASSVKFGRLLMGSGT